MSDVTKSTDKTAVNRHLDRMRKKLVSQDPVSNPAEPVPTVMKSALTRMSTAGTANSFYDEIDVNEIEKLFNPREVPCEIADVKSIHWPELDVPLDEVESALALALDKAKRSFWDVDPNEKAQILEFFVEIHELAQSLKRGQIQNIVVWQDPNTNRLLLLAGERRLFAALYSRGAKPTLAAKIYRGNLSTLDMRLITDQENTSKGLKPYEVVLSKYAIWNELDHSQGKIKLDVLQSYWLVAKGTVSLLYNLFTHENRDQLLEVIRKERLGWREIRAVVTGEVRVSGNSNATDVPAAQKGEGGLPVQAGKTAAPEKSSTVELSDGGGASAPSKPTSEAIRRAAAVSKRAKEFGLTLKNSTNTTVVSGVFRALSESNQLPNSIRAQLKEVRADEPDGLLRAWVSLAEHFGAT